MKRTTSFGIGSRTDFCGRQSSPPPNTYKLPSDFEFSGKKANAFSFGISREAYAKVYAESQPPADKAIPGPGTYNVAKRIGGDSSKFSFRARTSSLCNHPLPYFILVNSLIPKTPGPGTYTGLSSISKDGTQFYSKFENSRASHFNPPSSQRFKDLAQKISSAPGPGHYNMLPSLSETGNYFLAKYRSSFCRTFGHDVRDTLTTRGTHLGMK